MPLDAEEFLREGDGWAEPATGTPGETTARTTHPRDNAWIALWQKHPEGGGPFGGRSNALIRMVGFCRAKDFPYDAALAISQQWNRDQCDPPLPERNVQDAVSRGWARWSAGTIPDKSPRHASPLPIQNGRTPADWEVLSLQELLAYEAKTGGIQWLLPSVFVRGGIHIISCAPGGAKSWVLLELARALTSGDRWLGRFDLPAGNVLYVDEEMGPMKAVDRIKRLGFGTERALWYMGMQGFKLDRGDTLEKMLETLRAKEIEVLCLDTLTRCHDREENDNSAMRVVFQGLSKITEMGVTVLIAHHDRKRGGDDTVAHERMRGAGEIAAMCDMAYTLEKNADGSFVIRATKTRLISEGDGLRVTFVLEDSADRSRVSVRCLEETEKFERGRQQQHTEIERRILECLMEKPMTQTEMRHSGKVRGNSTGITAALKTLTERGQILVETLPGKGQAQLYSIPAFESDPDDG